MLGHFFEAPHCVRFLDIHWQIYQNFLLKAVWICIKYESHEVHLPQAAPKTFKHHHSGIIVSTKTIFLNFGMLKELPFAILCFLGFYPSQGADHGGLSLEMEKQVSNGIWPAKLTSCWVIKDRFLESPPTTILALFLPLIIYYWLSILSGLHSTIFLCFSQKTTFDRTSSQGLFPGSLDRAEWRRECTGTGVMQTWLWICLTSNWPSKGHFPSLTLSVCSSVKWAYVMITISQGGCEDLR